MNRRTYLVGAGTAATVGLAGCLDTVFGGSPGATDDVVLDEPERYEEFRDSRDRGHINHPIHADELPEVTVTDALSNRELSTREYVGDRHVLLTFIFTRCTMACPGLSAALAQVQANARAEGYEDELAFMPTTFDPEYDTPEVLEEYSEDMGAIPAADNWHFLRPESRERARETVGERMGVGFERLSEEEREEMEMPEHMVYLHDSAIYLANADGYVERGYVSNTRVPNAAELLDDVETLRERW